jgi:hypothetical protein
MTQYNTAAFDPTMEPPRTSVLAIVALILSLICLIPGFGTLGVILGVISLLLISGSQGRVSGTGLAVTAIVLGLLVSVVQVGIVVGVNQFVGVARNKLFLPVNQSFAAFDAGDVAAARKVLTPAANLKVSDEQFTAFRAAYQAELGAFKGIPDGILSIFKAYTQFGPNMQKYQGKPGQPPAMIPIPAIFERGTALVILQVDPAGPGPGGSDEVPVLDILIETTDGKTIKLSDHAGGTAAEVAPGTTPTDAAPASDTPAAPKPADPAPADAPASPKSGG